MRASNWFVAAVFVFALVADRSAQATINNCGSVTGTGTPYNGSDNPWATGSLIVGGTAPGSMSVTGGYVVNNTGGGIVADQSASTTSSVIVDGAGSAWNNTSFLTVAHSGSGTLTISGGGSVSNTTANIANSFSQGTITVGGGTGSSTWTNSGQVSIGISGGTGTLNVIGGGSVSDTVGQIGSSVGSFGIVNVGGGTGNSIWTNSSSMSVGAGGSTGMLTITGGGSVSDTTGVIGGSSVSTGTVTVGGGTGSSTWTNSSTLTAGLNGASTLNINTGGLVSATALDGGEATSSVKFGGGTLRVTATDSASNTINLLAGGGTFDVPTAGSTFTVTSAISGAGSLTKTGAATLDITAANGYSGNTTVSTGTLKLGARGSLANSPTISVASGATLDVTDVVGGSNYDGTRFSLASGQTLKGTGTIVGTIGVTGGATLAPGDSPGLLSLQGNYVQGATGNLAIEIGGTTPGSTGYDVLGITGAATLGGNLTVVGAAQTESSSRRRSVRHLISSLPPVAFPARSVQRTRNGSPATNLSTSRRTTAPPRSHWQSRRSTRSSRAISTATATWTLPTMRLGVPRRALIYRRPTAITAAASTQAITLNGGSKPEASPVAAHRSQLPPTCPSPRASLWQALRC